jgi:hypothetical protein
VLSGAWKRGIYKEAGGIRESFLGGDVPDTSPEEG